MFTNTPTQSTYRTDRFPFAGVGMARDGTYNKDLRLVNYFQEQVEDHKFGQKKFLIRERAGTSWKYDTGFTGAGRGIYYFNGSIYAAIGNKLYRDTTPVATLGNSSGRVGFTQFNGTYTALIVLDGIKGFVIKTDNSVTEITDADFPTPHLPFPVFIDGYLFVGKAGTDDIYNSDLEDPLTWTAGNFITAELYPDTLKALSKSNNYLLAIGESTTEHFYDAGVASGSPLQRNDSAVKQMGSLAPDSVVTMDDGVVFVGNTDNGGFTVWFMYGFEVKEIGVPPVKQTLTAEGSNIGNVVGTVIRAMGHKFYVLSCSTRTWVYNFDDEQWHEWSYQDDQTPWLFKHSCGHPDGHARLLHPTNGNVMAIDENVASDAVNQTTTVPIYAVVVTPKVDFESNNRKACNRLSVVGDFPTSNTSMVVKWSDNDYQTWSIGRTLLVTGGFNSITQLGQFRRRAFKFIYAGTTPIRLVAFELDVNIGNK